MVFGPPPGAAPASDCVHVVGGWLVWGDVAVASALALRIDLCGFRCVLHGDTGGVLLDTQRRPAGPVCGGGYRSDRIDWHGGVVHRPIRLGSGEGFYRHLSSRLVGARRSILMYRYDHCD